MKEALALFTVAAIGCASTPPPATPIPIDGDTPAPNAQPAEKSLGKHVVMVESGTDIQGRLPPDVIKRIVRANFPRLRACYEGLLKAKPDADELATTRFIINESGKVTNVEVATPDVTFRACIETIVSSLEFPEPEKGKVLVVYPIRFHLVD